jgi:uncharacterized protein involved in outer membrane biogenesis
VGSYNPGMVRKILIVGVTVVIVASIGLFFWAKAVFTQETVRTALAEQLSKSLGQPVAIGGISASIFPRVTVNLTGVELGRPARIHVQTLRLGTDFRAVLSRRIEHAAIQLKGAKIELPLPEFAITSTPADSGVGPVSSSVKIVSIDEIVLREVDVTSGGRTLHGDIEVVPQGAGLSVRKLTLGAGKTTIEITGRITDLAGPTGELSMKTGTLNLDELLAFISEFAGGAGAPAPAGAPSAQRAAAKPGSPAMNLSVSIDADSSTLGGLVLQKLSGRARLTPGSVAFAPVRFDLFGGSYDGTLTLKPGAATHFNLNAALAGVDMAALTRFAGSADTITGRLSGKVDLSGSGTDATSVLRSGKGTARVDITNGVVKRLGLVRTVITATSGRSGAPAASGGVSSDEPFARLGATLAVANGSATTTDLRFESNDLLLAAAGTMAMDGSAMNLVGQLQLSDKLSQQAGRDLVRYTQEQGRATLPVTVTGSAENPQVSIDLESVARRAVTNRATEEAQKAVKKGLGQLFGR